MGQFKQTLFLGNSSLKKYGIGGSGDGDKDAYGKGGSLYNGNTDNIGEGTCGRSSSKTPAVRAACYFPMTSMATVAVLGGMHCCWSQA